MFISLNFTAVRNDGNDSDVIVVSPGNSPVSGNRNSQPPPPRREDSSLDNWESRVLTAGDPYFPGFAPIRRTYRTDDLPSLNPYAGLRYKVLTFLFGWVLHGTNTVKVIRGFPTLLVDEDLW